MAPTNRSVIMSVFTDNAQAQQAMDDLQRAGFGPDQIRYSVRKGGTGITDSLENLGLPEEEASFYNREFEAGRTVVMVNTNDRQQEASDILARDGGYDYTSRSGQKTGYANTASSGKGTDYNTEAAQNVQLREEQVTVEKQPYVREEVAMGKRPVQETKQVSDTVRREEAHVERAGDVDVQGTEEDTASGS